MDTFQPNFDVNLKMPLLSKNSSSNFTLNRDIDLAKKNFCQPFLIEFPRLIVSNFETKSLRELKHH